MISDLFNVVGTSSLLLVVSITICILWTWLLYKHPYKNVNLPPCPVPPWPLLGHLPILGVNLREKMHEWRETSGGIYSVYFGRDLYIVVGDFSIIKEIMIKHSHNVINTAPSLIGDVLKENNKGIISARDDNWKAQRSTSVSILRSFGMGKKVMTVKIQSEVLILIEKLLEVGGQPVDPRLLLSKCMTNIMSSLTVGERFDHDDPRLARIVENVSVIIKNAAFVMLLTSLKFLLYLPGDLFHIKRWAKAALGISGFIRAYMATYTHSSETFDPSGSFIAAYLQEMRNVKTKCGVSHLSEDNLKSIVRVLLVSGTESTSSTILWCLLYMLHYPKVQEKVYSEILTNIGLHRLPNMADKPKLVYLNAVILETQRMATVVPTGQRREVSDSFEVHGFTIPKGSIIWPLIFLVHHDKKIWGDPENFRPERFINSNGTVEIPEELILFGIGKRVCIGEGLAMMELFLFLSAMCQRFKFEPADTSQALPTLTSDFAAVCTPRDFQIRAVLRDDWC